jgi:sulfofructose kinase
VRVVGIGQCSWDYLAVVDSFPAGDTKAEVSDWQEQGGGPVATALVTLARLGIPGDFHGIAGDDPEGDKIRESLRSEGIDISGLVRRERALSQKAFIAIERGSAKRTIFWERPSGAPLLPGELPEALLADCCFLLLDGLMPEASLFAAEKARNLGIPVMLDAGKVRPGMLEIARLCDYLVASEQFALDLGWDGDPAAFQRQARSLGAAVVTITLGERGSITYRNREIISLPAFPIEARDTTGAGDVFHGAYIYGLLRGLDLSGTIRFASAVAAMKCRMIGGRAGIPDRTQVLRFLADKESIISFTD